MEMLLTGRQVQGRATVALEPSRVQSHLPDGLVQIHLIYIKVYWVYAELSSEVKHSRRIYVTYY